MGLLKGAPTLSWLECSLPPPPLRIGQQTAVLKPTATVPCLGPFELSPDKCALQEGSKVAVLLSTHRAPGSVPRALHRQVLPHPLRWACCDAPLTKELMGLASQCSDAGTLTFEAVWWITCPKRRLTLEWWQW